MEPTSEEILELESTLEEILGLPPKTEAEKKLPKKRMVVLGREIQDDFRIESFCQECWDNGFIVGLDGEQKSFLLPGGMTLQLYVVHCQVHGDGIPHIMGHSH